MRSEVNITEPLPLFSKGTTPRWVEPDWTAVKTSAMVVQGERVWVGEGKVDRAACFALVLVWDDEGK